MVDLFSEVEEEVRKERWEQLWKRYGTVMIIGAGTVVVSVAGWQAWERYSLAQRESASIEFNAAINVAQAGNVPQAEAQFITLGANAPEGYETLAAFLVAKTQIDQGKRDAAIASLRQLVADPNPLLSSPARLQLAWLLAETDPRADVETLITPLQDEQSPWRFAAAEISAYLDYHAGNWEQAAAAYQALAVAPGVTEGTAQRVGAIAQFLRASTPETANAAFGTEIQNPEGETALPETNDQGTVQ